MADASGRNFINFGPQPPAAHRILHRVLELYGEAAERREFAPEKRSRVNI
jgi:NADH:ubiquinone oxidoreductase subunit D